jgi:large subunit ribosomal protein L11
MPIIKLIVDGGSMKPGPAVAQQLGPIGINLGKVIEDTNKATSGFKGMKVPVEIDVDAKTKVFDIKVFSPPVSELIKKELKIEKGSGDAGKVKKGNLAIEQVIGIAKTKLPNMLAKNLKAAVNLVIGSCVSLGILVENKEAKEVIEDTNAGKYDTLISEEKTEVSPEKKAKLDKFFAQVKSKQEEAIKAEEEAKAAEEAAKTEVALDKPEGKKSEDKPEGKKEEAKEEKKEAKK